MTLPKPASRSVAHLQLVRTPKPAPDIPIGTQLELPRPPARLFIVNMSMATKYSFVSFLTNDKPSILFDLRPVPSFLLDAFSRQAAFWYFEHCEIHYFDLAGTLEINSYLDASQTSGRVTAYISEVISRLRVEPDRIGVLLDKMQVPLWSEHGLHEAIRPRPQGGWKLESIPKPRPSAL